MDDETTLHQHRIKRRTVLKTAAVGTGALMLGGVFATHQQSVEAATFYNGADISWVPQMEAKGYFWKNAHGVWQDIRSLLWL